MPTKLTSTAAQSIRAAHARGEATVRELAAMHGVSVETVRRVLRGDTWGIPETRPTAPTPDEINQSLARLQGLLTTEEKTDENTQA
jgi:predicted transcriptional regulator